MSVLDRGYRRWRGTPTPYLERMLVIPRYALADVVSRRATQAVWLVSIVPPLLLGLAVYFSANASALRAMFPFIRSVNTPDMAGPRIFAAFTAVQLQFAVVLAMITGPRLIASDMAGGALPLYFSKALRRRDYLLGKCGVLFGVLSTATWLPLLLVFGLRWSLMPSARAGEGWVARAILLVTVSFCVLLTLLMTAISAYVRRAWLAPFLLLGLFVTAGAVGTTIDAATGSWAGRVVSPWNAVARLHEWAFTAPGPAEPPRPWSPPSMPAGMAFLVVAGWSAAAAVVLVRRVRSVDVVR